jgi:hypothetical protein
MEPRWQPYARIARPLEAHGCSTPDAYAAYQQGIIATNRANRPTMNWREPFEADSAGVAAQISGGKWVAICPACSNAPIFDPDWRIARCCQCGAVYRISPPDRWDTAELVLMARPDMAQRNWTPDTETIEDLIRQNLEAGDPAGVPTDLVASVVALQRVDAVSTRTLTFTDSDPVPAIEHDGAAVTLAVDASVYGSDFAAVLDTLQAAALETAAPAPAVTS